MVGDGAAAGIKLMNSQEFKTKFLGIHGVARLVDDVVTKKCKKKIKIVSSRYLVAPMLTNLS